MHVVQQEHALAERRQQLIELRPIEAGAGRSRCALEAVEHAGFVALGLQAPQHPGAGIGQCLVVQVHRVLGGHGQAQAERARLLEQREQRRLRRRIGNRRQETENLVEVHQRPQAGGAALAAHPADQLIEQQRDEKHPLLIVQVRDRDDADAGPAVGAVEQAVDVQRLALQPRAEPWRRQQLVELHGQLEAILGGVERLEVEDTHLGQGRRLHLRNQRRQIEIDADPPRLGK